MLPSERKTKLLTAFKDLVHGQTSEKKLEELLPDSKPLNALVKEVRSNLTDEKKEKRDINYTSELFWLNNMENATKMIRAGHLRNCHDSLYNAAVEDALTTYNECKSAEKAIDLLKAELDEVDTLMRDVP